MKRPLSLARSSLIGYTILFVVSLVVGYWQGRLSAVFTFPGWFRAGTNILIGCLIAFAAVKGSSAMRSTFQWARQLEAEFRLILTPLNFVGVVVLAAASGIVEEIFFRAIMQPVFGLWITSLGFGLLHYPMNRRLVPWTILAAAMGFVLGITYQVTESLLAVATAHGLINFFELYRICRTSSIEPPI